MSHVTKILGKYPDFYRKCYDQSILNTYYSLFQCRDASDKEMQLKHSAEMIEKLKSTCDMTEDELKEMSTKYDYIYFHPVCIDDRVTPELRIFFVFSS